MISACQLACLKAIWLQISCAYPSGVSIGLLARAMSRRSFMIFAIDRQNNNSV